MKITHKTTTSLLITAISISLISSVAHADWSIGIGVDNEAMRYEDKKNDVDLTALFDIQYRGDKFNIEKDTLSYEFTHSDKFAAEVIATVKNRGFKASDNNTFKGMSKRETSFDLGGRVIVETGLLGLAAIDITKDIGKSEGLEATIKLGGIAPHSPHWTGKRKVNIAAVTGLRYQDEASVDYYYGVKNSEATNNRRAYKGESAITPFIGFETQANLTKHITIDGGLGVSKTASSIKNSPLTEDRDYQLEANIGFHYWF